MDPKPIPAFYCCYLLRSTVRHKILYVGSTPKPARRLPQHNGHNKGGARKTAKASDRPWEMTCIVSGFPSNIAALQFEWAWQHARLTRHNPENSRAKEKPSDDASKTLTLVSEKANRTRKRPKSPDLGLQRKLEDLHLLLRAPYFKRWPLTVRFFSKDTFNVWRPYCEREDAAATLPSGVEIFRSFGPVEGSKSLGNAEEILPLLARLKMLETSYDPVKKHLEKSLSILREGEEIPCRVCKRNLDISTDSIVVCSEGGCRCASHMNCLAARFLEKIDDTASMVPTNGACPECWSTLQWATLIKEMTLRMYGGKEATKLLRKRRGVAQVDEDDDNNVDIDEAVELTAADVAGEDVDAEDMDDTASIMSNESDMSEIRGVSTFRMPPRLSMLVEESDWEGAERLL